jgi:DNA (cytosine-5)-methyltransferase 1
MATIGSLCSGIGGLDIAAEEHFGATLSWHSDIDPKSNEVMAHYWPDAVGIGDFTTTDASTLEPVDVITCGFPCQPVSVAGVHKGTNDERWLFHDIADFITQLPQLPKVLVLENVRNFLSHDKGRTALGVFRQVADLGFDLRYGVVRASDAGLPHRRERFFAVATNTNITGTDPWTERTRRQTSPRSTTAGRQITADSYCPGLEGSQHPERHDLFTGSRYEPAVRRWERISGLTAPSPLDEKNRVNPRFVEWMCGHTVGFVTDLISTRTHNLRLLGNSVCPPQASLALDLLTKISPQ